MAQDQRPREDDTFHDSDFPIIAKTANGTDIVLIQIVGISSFKECYALSRKDFEHTIAIIEASRGLVLYIVGLQCYV